MAAQINETLEAAAGSELAGAPSAHVPAPPAFAAAFRG